MEDRARSRAEDRLLIVGLEVQGMKHRVQVAVTEHLDGIKAMVGPLLEEAIGGFDFRAEAKRLIDAELHRQLKQLMSTSLIQAYHDAGVSSFLRETFTESLRKLVRDHSEG